MKAAAIQMVSTNDFEHNLLRSVALLRQASEQGAELAVLPETFLTYGTRQLPGGEPERRFVETMASEAAGCGLWIVAGSYPMNYPVPEPGASAGKPHAVSPVFDPQGKVAGAYAKIHLFDVDVSDQNRRYRESDDFVHGSDVVAVDSPWGPLGIAVCYDLRFPELFTELARQGCRIICLPSAFTHVTGQAHWEVLVRARAIETQCFIVASDQGGLHSETRETWGGSMIVSPWGEVLQQLPKGEGVVMADVDLTQAEQVRKSMPLGQHRRLVPSY